MRKGVGQSDGGAGGWKARRQKARSNFRVCDVLINYESFGRTFADSSTGDRLRRLRNEFVIVVGPDGKRELSATCACVDRANVERLPNLLPISFPKITRAIQARIHTYMYTHTHVKNRRVLYL